MHDRKIFVKSPKQRPYIFPDEESLWRNGKVVQEIKKVWPVIREFLKVSTPWPFSNLE